MDEGGIQSSLALFRRRKVELGEERIEFVEHRPISHPGKKSVIVFSIQDRSPRYIDFKRSRFQVEYRILNDKGLPINLEADNVAMINLPHSTAFRQCDVLIQQIDINPDIGINYAYKAYIDALLNFSEDDKESHLQSEGFYTDTAHAVNSNDPKDRMNVGLYMRSLLTNNGGSALLSGPLYHDAFQLDRYLLNNVPILIRLQPASDAFALISPNSGYQLEIVSATLEMCHVHVNPDVVAMHNDGLKLSPAIYPFTKSDIKTYSAPAGVTSFTANNLFQGRVPSRLVVGLTPEHGYSGTYQTNPLYFPHMNANYLAFTVNGVSRPSQPFMPDFKNNKYVISYLSLYRSMGSNRKNTGNYIGYNDYPAGYALHVFDVHSTEDVGVHAKRSHGQTMLDIKFAEPLNEPATVVVYASFSGVIEIDSSRNVSVKL